MDIASRIEQWRGRDSIAAIQAGTSASAGEAAARFGLRASAHCCVWFQDED